MSLTSFVFFLEEIETTPKTRSEIAKIINPHSERVGTFTLLVGTLTFD